MAAPLYANPNEHRAPMKSPSECGHRPGVPAGWKLGETGGSAGPETGRSPRRPIDNQGLLMEAARRLRQRSSHSRAFWRASHAPTFRTPAGSAAASCWAPSRNPGVQAHPDEPDGALLLHRYWANRTEHSVESCSTDRQAP